MSFKEAEVETVGWKKLELIVSVKEEEESNKKEKEKKKRKLQVKEEEVESVGWKIANPSLQASIENERCMPCTPTRAQTLSTPCPVRCQSYIVTPRQIVQCRNQCMHSAVLAHGRHWCDGDHDHPRLIGPDESAFTH